MKESWFDNLLSYLRICRFNKFCKSIFYLSVIGFMIYLGYSREAGKKPVQQKFQEKMLNDKNSDGIFMNIDSLFWADFQVLSLDE